MSASLSCGPMTCLLWVKHRVRLHEAVKVSLGDLPVALGFSIPEFYSFPAFIHQILCNHSSYKVKVRNRLDYKLQRFADVLRQDDWPLSHLREISMSPAGLLLVIKSWTDAKAHALGALISCHGNMIEALEKSTGKG